MILTIDLETRSRIGISGGAWKYAHHESTEIMCVGYQIDDNPTKLLWLGECRYVMNSDNTWAEFEDLVRSADEIVAHNAEFEIAMLYNKLLPERFNEWVLKIRDTMAQCAMLGIPSSLDKSTQLILKARKDMAGNMLMKKLCVPDKKTGDFLMDAESLSRLGDYCKQDVNITYQLYQALPKLPKQELKIWQKNLEINKRGISVDRQLVDQALEKWEKYTLLLEEKFLLLTDGELAPRQVTKYADFAKKKYGYNGITKLTADSTRMYLEDEKVPEGLKELLRIRQILSFTSIKKFDTMKEMLEPDDKIRGLFRYHEAMTGRWAGQTVQPHNLPRGCDEIDSDEAAEYVRDPNVSSGLIELIYGERQFHKVLKSCVRAAFVGNLTVMDYSAIEARVLAWLAGEEKALNAFRNDVEIYKAAASEIYSKPINQISSEERQIGKVSILACGYQGAVGAFQAMAPVYGVVVPDSQAEAIVKRWREANPNIVSYWKAVNDAAIKAMINKYTVYTARSVSFCYEDDRFLTCLLPSGRKIYYFDPILVDKSTPWGDVQKELRYKTITNGQHVYTSTYGGKLVENITQAVARDLMANAMLNLDNIVLHIHDEIVTENVPEESVKRAMITLPDWATGLPIATKGWTGKRYKKE
jgi:DNA polymerase bacteriophage-type